MDRWVGPGRALSRRGLAWLLAALAVWNLLIASFLFLIHAWPVPIFLGLDFVGVLVAFRVSNARAAQRERVTVSAERVSITRHDGETAHTLWSSPTGFTRVIVERFERNARVRLAISGRTTTLGAALGVDDRLAFGRELERAVTAARAERW